MMGVICRIMGPFGQEKMARSRAGRRKKLTPRARLKALVSELLQDKSSSEHRHGSPPAAFESQKWCSTLTKTPSRKDIEIGTLLSCVTRTPRSLQDQFLDGVEAAERIDEAVLDKFPDAQGLAERDARKRHNALIDLVDYVSKKLSQSGLDQVLRIVWLERSFAFIVDPYVIFCIREADELMNLDSLAERTAYVARRSLILALFSSGTGRQKSLAKQIDPSGRWRTSVLSCK